MNDSASEHVAEVLGSTIPLQLSPQGLADFFRAHINANPHPVPQPLQTTNLLQLQPQIQEQQENETVDQQAILDMGLQLVQENNNYESASKVDEAPKSKRRGGGGAKKTKRESNATPGAVGSEKISPFPIQDDYKWRKYGQKTLKGSEFPRDYFKCSVPQCNAKKQVEKCIENGEEKLRYIYFGEHTHPPPKSSHLYAKDQQSFKTAVIAAFDPFVADADKLNSEFLEELEEATDGVQQIDANNMLNGVQELTDGQVAQADPNHQAQEQQQEQQNYEGMIDSNKLMMTASTEDQVLNMLKDDSAQQNQQNGEMMDPNLMSEYAQVENSVQGDHVMDGTAINYEEYMQGEQQPPTKKRKASRKKSSSSQIRRLIVECTKDIDYMEDGYHWRKYGQKTLKGNPFPRSYYKCIEPNCSVRKQVEQTLGGSIINIYEGYHNHAGNPQAVPNEAHKRKHHEMAQAEIENTLFNTLLSELNEGQSSPKRLKTGEENVPNGLLNTSMLLTTPGSIPIQFDMANLQYLFTHSSVPNILKGSADNAGDSSNNTNNTNVQLVESTNNNNANDNVSSENEHLLTTSAEQLNDVNLPNVDSSVDEQSTM